jgi:TRAP-type C4-dicarboxylate transport system permease small subunit
MLPMSHAIATLFIALVILGALSAISLGWRFGLRNRGNSTGPRWRTIAALFARVLVTLSVLLFAAYVTRNAIIGGDRDGGPTTLAFIRAGNYLSFVAAICSLADRGRARWATLSGSCLMLFIWFSEGMSL